LAVWTALVPAISAAQTGGELAGGGKGGGYHLSNEQMGEVMRSFDVASLATEREAVGAAVGYRLFVLGEYREFMIQVHVSDFDASAESSFEPGRAVLTLKYLWKGGVHTATKELKSEETRELLSAIQQQEVFRLPDLPPSDYPVADDGNAYRAPEGEALLVIERSLKGSVKRIYRSGGQGGPSKVIASLFLRLAEGLEEGLQKDEKGGVEKGLKPAP